VVGRKRRKTSGPSTPVIPAAGRSGTAMCVTAALLLLPLVGPSTSMTSIGSAAASASGDPRRVAAVDPELAREPVPSTDAEHYGATGDVPAADEPSPELLARANNIAALTSALNVVNPQASVPPGPLGIPGIALLAYENAASHLREAKPGCGLEWSLVAAIGRIESGHAHGGRVDAAGRTLEPILGIALDGRPGVAAIADTDGGALDGDTRWDRAVGPMQFIPSTWPSYAADGNGDGVRDPHNIFDAAVATGRLLCAGDGDLRDPVQRARAVYRYNHSDSYVATVLVWADAYQQRVAPVDVPPGPTPPPPGVPDAGLVVPPVPLPPLPPGDNPAPAPAAPGTVLPEIPGPVVAPDETTTTTAPVTTTTTTTMAPEATTTTEPVTTTTTPVEVPPPVTTTTTTTTTPSSPPACPPPGTSVPGTVPSAPGTTVVDPPPACTP
jgi:membrane-bound lytic murein transglycosylase B